MEYNEHKGTYEAEMYIDPQGDRRISVRGDAYTQEGGLQKSGYLATHFFDEQPTLYYLDTDELDWLIAALQNLRPYVAEPKPIPPF